MPDEKKEQVRPRPQVLSVERAPTATDRDGLVRALALILVHAATVPVKKESEE